MQTLAPAASPAAVALAERALPEVCATWSRTVPSSLAWLLADFEQLDDEGRSPPSWRPGREARAAQRRGELRCPCPAVGHGISAHAGRRGGPYMIVSNPAKNRPFENVAVMVTPETMRAGGPSVQVTINRRR